MADPSSNIDATFLDRKIGLSFELKLIGAPVQLRIRFMISVANLNPAGLRSEDRASHWVSLFVSVTSDLHDSSHSNSSRVTINWTPWGVHEPRFALPYPVR